MDGTYSTDLFFNKAIEWMDVLRQVGKSCFIYLPPKSLQGPYKQNSSDIPNEDYKIFFRYHPQMNIQVAKIYWEVEYIDKRIGEMIQQFEEWEIADNILFIFIGSDNGSSGVSQIFNTGMKDHKWQAYQGGLAFLFSSDGGGLKVVQKRNIDKSNGHHAHPVRNYQHPND